MCNIVKQTFSLLWQRCAKKIPLCSFTSSSPAPLLCFSQHVVVHFLCFHGNVPLASLWLLAQPRLPCVFVVETGGGGDGLWRGEGGGGGEPDQGAAAGDLHHLWWEMFTLTHLEGGMVSAPLTGMSWNQTGLLTPLCSVWGANNSQNLFLPYQKITFKFYIQVLFIVCTNKRDWIFPLLIHLHNLMYYMYNLYL